MAQPESAASFEAPPPPLRIAIRPLHAAPRNSLKKMANGLGKDRHSCAKPAERDFHPAAPKSIAGLFPYPSGAGLPVGHRWATSPANVRASAIRVSMSTMPGDAFGCPRSVRVQTACTGETTRNATTQKPHPAQALWPELRWQREFAQSIRIITAWSSGLVRRTTRGTTLNRKRRARTINDRSAHRERPLCGFAPVNGNANAQQRRDFIDSRASVSRQQTVMVPKRRPDLANEKSRRPVRARRVSGLSQAENSGVPHHAYANADE